MVRGVRGSQSLVMGVSLLLGALACSAGEIELDGGGTLIVSDTAFSRILPHAFHDQAIASLPHLFPEHVLLTSRRSGVLGEVVYALICFRESPVSDRVVIQAVAVHRDRAWRLETEAPPRYGDTLLQVLEQIGKLPRESRTTHR